MGISDFWISGQSLINENCQNSRISNDIDMKLGPVTKLDKRNTATSNKKSDKDIMFVNSDVRITFPIYGQLGGIQRRLVCNTYIFINSNLLPNKN